MTNYADRHNLSKKIVMAKGNKNKKYLFQIKKISFTKRLFNKGLNTATFILLGLKDLGEEFLKNFLEGLPSTHPGFKLMKDMFGYSSKRCFKRNTIQININRLKKAGLITESENRKFFLTEKGKELVLHIKNRYSILNKPWDGKFRLVVFDIPEEKRYLRIWIRGELLLLQYKALQKSVYIGKYPLPDDFYQDLIKKGIFQNIHLFVIDKFDKEKEIFNLFND